MAPKPVLLNAFYDQLFQFLKELTAMYPEDPDFPMGSTALRMVKLTMPAYPIKEFYDSSKGFEDQILSKNELFFLDHSFSEIQHVDFDILGKLKTYLKSMSPISKDAVWIYVQNLYKLAKAYHN